MRVSAGPDDAKVLELVSGVTTITAVRENRIVSTVVT